MCIETAFDIEWSAPVDHSEVLTPNAVELIPTLEALPPRGGPVEDPVLTVSPSKPESRNLRFFRVERPGESQRGTGVPRSEETPPS